MPRAEIGQAVGQIFRISDELFHHVTWFFRPKAGGNSAQGVALGERYRGIRELAWIL